MLFLSEKPVGLPYEKTVKMIDTISELFIITTTGHVLAKRKLKHDIKVNATEMFMAKLQESEQLLPHFELDGIQFCQIRRQQIYFVAVCRKGTSPIFIIEILTRLYNLLKDFCGLVTESSLDKNMILVYEVLDEMFNDGLLQLTVTDKIKPHVLSQPVVIQSEDSLVPGLFGIERRLAPSDAANKPVIRSKWDEDQRKNEVFVDVIERMNVLIAANGTIARCSVQGQVTMKSFLIGCPEMKMALNEDITVGQEERKKGYGSMVHLDKMSLHPCVKSITENNVLSIHPPEGEFTLISYNLQGDLPHGLPFRIYTYVEDKGSLRDIEIGVKLRCEIPNHCQVVSITVNLPVPKTTTSISQRLSGTNQTAEFSVAEKKVIWKLRRISGKNEVSAHFVLIDAKEHSSCVTDLGPVALTFEISGFVTSGLQIRFVHVFDREHSYVPTRWIRYITTADSYICKL